MKGVLNDIKVLDFSTLLPGPMASLFLSDAGADVLKIERPETGEEMRSYTPKWGKDSANFNILNRGKKSLALDLKDPAAREILEPLLREADILIEQFRPGVMARLGLGYDAISAINPNIIYCSISGYGQTGPKVKAAGHDLNYIGDAGLLALSYGQNEHPVLPPALIADIAGGTYPALLNILLALRARDAGHGGAYLDISMAENLFPFLYWAMADGQVANQWPENGEALVTGGSPRYQLYATSDGKILAAAPLEDKFWQVFCDAIELEATYRDDAKDPAATKQRIADIINSQTGQYWAEIFERANCCCSLVKTLDEAMHDPHFQARGVFHTLQTNENGETMIGLPTPIAPNFKSQSSEAARAPKLGEHNSVYATVKSLRGYNE